MLIDFDAKKNKVKSILAKLTDFCSVSGFEATEVQIELESINLFTNAISSAFTQYCLLSGLIC